MTKVVKPKAPVKPKRVIKAKRVPAPKLTTAQRLDIIGADVIFERIAKCEFIHKIAASYDMSAAMLHEWLNAHAEQYVVARERQADQLVEDMLQIADDGRNDTYRDADGNVRTDQDVIARSRLRVEARKWLAGKMNAKRYGDRLHAEVTGANGGPVQIQKIERVIIDVN